MSSAATRPYEGVGGNAMGISFTGALKAVTPPHRVKNI